MKAAYHGYLPDPPFAAAPGLECWVPLEPADQSENAAIRDLMMELTREAEERGIPGPAPLEETMEAFRRALQVGRPQLEDDGSDFLHWFLLRWI